MLAPTEMIPAEYRQSGFTDCLTPGRHLARRAEGAATSDEFFLDPTRITLVCGTAGYDGTAVQGPAGQRVRHPDQQDLAQQRAVCRPTSTTRAATSRYLIKVLAEISQEIETRLAEGGDAERAAFAARVKSLMEDVPDLPNFSRFHDGFRDDPKSTTLEGDMREAFYMAYDADDCEYVTLDEPGDRRAAARGPELVSANFVIPYPPGFPIMVPGQVITTETIAFMRKLDVKEIHGYDAARGLKLIKLGARQGAGRKRAPAAPSGQGTPSKGDGMRTHPRVETFTPAMSTDNKPRLYGAIGPEDIMIDWFFATLQQYPEIAIFLTLAFGYYFGKFTFKGIGLGSVTATLLAGVLIGQIGITISQPLKATVFLHVPVRRRLRRRAAVRPRRRQGRPAAGDLLGGPVRVLPARPASRSPRSPATTSATRPGSTRARRRFPPRWASRPTPSTGWAWRPTRPRRCSTRCRSPTP